MNDLGDFLTDSGHHSQTPAWWNFEFPSGRGANVWLSATPFTFDMEVDRSADEDDGMDTFTEQTTEQVLERLTELADEPGKVTGCLKLWTHYGEMDAEEAMNAGLR